MKRLAALLRDIGWRCAVLADRLERRSRARRALHPTPADISGHVNAEIVAEYGPCEASRKIERDIERFGRNLHVVRGGR